MNEEAMWWTLAGLAIGWVLFHSAPKPCDCPKKDPGPGNAGLLEAGGITCKRC
jgi:hypothetical protein